MATTSDYLSELVKQKTALANNLVTKGVEANKDEKFNTLVPKVLAIPTGGSEPQFGDDFPLLDGKTHIWLKYPSEGSNRTFVLNFRLNSGTFTIDYGDGTTETITELASSNASVYQTITHEYKSGNYVVTIACDGELAFGRPNLNTPIFGDTMQIQNVYLFEIGNGIVELGNSSLYYMGFLKKLAINIGEGNVLSTCSNSLYQCPAIESVKIYSGTTYHSNHAFPAGSNYSLVEIDVDKITNPTASIYRYAYAIQKIVFPDTVKKLNGLTMQSNYAVDEITFPKNVDSIAGNGINSCTNIKKVTFKGKPTSIASNAFQSMTQECDVYVPWAEDEVANSPWGLTGATIHYNYTESEEE